MFSGLRVFGLCFLGMFVGCGGSSALSTANSGKLAPHGGTLFPLPDGQGRVEIVKKEGTAPITAEVSIYFYKQDSTPFNPAPTTGTLVLDDKRKVTLQADGDAMVTPAGPVLFGDRDVEGRLLIELEGRLVRIPIGMR